MDEMPDKSQVELPSEIVTIEPLQFTIRGLMIFTAVIAVFFALATQVPTILAFNLIGLLFLVTALWLRANKIASLIGGLFFVGWFFVGLFSVVSELSEPPVRSVGRRNVCETNLRHIGLAILNYEAENGHLPPAFVADENGKPMYSWRVLIMPEFEMQDEYDLYYLKEPWDGPNNRTIDKCPPSFQCPIEYTSNRLIDLNLPDPPIPDTVSYVAVGGPGTAWPGDKKIKMSDFVDGPGYTILVIEIANSDIRFTEPRDLDIRQMSMIINSKTGFKSNHRTGVSAVFADGSVRSLPNDLSPKMLKALLTIDGGEDVSEFFERE